MMKIKKFEFNPFQVNTYVLYDDKHCVVIDPAMYFDAEFRKLQSFFDEIQLKPEAMIITHFHFDHLMGCNKIMEAYKPEMAGHADYSYLHGSNTVVEQAKLFTFTMDEPPAVTKVVNDGDVLEYGSVRLEVIHVPGHSPCGIALYNREQKVLFTGDILFAQGIGRTDLFAGDYGLLIRGIQKKLLTLPDDTVVYPGHGPETTIGDEKRLNPFL